MKKKILIKITCIINIFFIIFSITNIKLKAENPFITETIDRYGELVETQNAYQSVNKIKQIGEYTLDKPSDIYIDQDDYLYICDTGNKRIIILDENYQYKTSFGNDVLYKPTGIYVRENLIYIADYGKESDLKSGKIAVFEYNKETNDVKLKEERYTPKSKVLEIDGFIYRPEKIAVDKNNTMYVVSEGSYNGILTINADNRFMSYFAPNNVQTTLKEKITNFLYGDNEKVNLKDILPTPACNVCIDDSGYIYTVTQSLVSLANIGDTLKKVNIGGENFYPTKMLASSEFVSCSTGKYGNVFAATKSGFIYEYDLEGNVIFIFSGTSTEIDQLGLFKRISGIVVNSKDELIILDPNDNSFQIFEPTLYANTIHQALGLYNEGKYNESKELWEQVLVFNAMTDKAHKGIGLSYYLNGDYHQALEEFRLANAKEEYSNAYWEIRNEWFSNNLGLIFLIFILIVILIFVLNYLNKKKQIGKLLKEKNKEIEEKHPWYYEISLMFKLCFKPLDTTYFIKRNKKMKYLNGLFILLIFFGIYILGLTSTGFIFNKIVIEKTILLKETLKVIIPIILFILANFLTASLLEGEGTFRGIFLTTIACLLPIIILYPLAVIVSNILTYNESFLYYFIIFVMIAWSLVLLFVVNKELHNYSFGKMLLNILVTVVLMFVLLIVIILSYLMVYQIIDFIKDIISEVVFNG